MAGFKVNYDPKAKLVTVEHENLLDEVRKGYKDVVKVNVFQVVVEVAMETAISDKSEVEAEARKAAQGVEKDVLKELEETVKLLRKLQEDEKKGNKKAATEAEKETKKREKSLKKFAAEFGIDIRKSVQKEYSRQSGSKAQLRSVNRSVFRGMELNEDAFECEADNSEAVGDLAQLAGKLAGGAKEIAKNTQKEKELRRALATEVERVHGLIEAKRGKSKEFDIHDFAKENSKDAKAVQSLASNYGDFLNSLHDTHTACWERFTAIQKIVDKSDKLQNDKQLVKAMNEYGGGQEVVRKMLQDYKEASNIAEDLFKEKYSNGEEWKRLLANLNTLKGCTKSGKAMQDGASDLAKYAKG